VISRKIEDRLNTTETGMIKTEIKDIRQVADNLPI
jgi:hypothetical protein